MRSFFKKHQNFKNSQVFLLGQVLLTSALLLPEAFFYPGFLQQKLGIGFTSFAAFSLILQIATYAYFRNPTNKIIKFIGAGALTTSVVTIIFYFLEEMLYPNFVFSTLHLHPSVIRDIALYLWAGLIMPLLPRLITPIKKSAIFFPLLCIFFLFFLHQTFLELFIQIGIENGFVEWSTFLLFVITGILSLKNSHKQFYLNKLLSIFFFGLGVALIVLAAEEISWGKWVFNFSTPEYFLQNNVQHEPTIHNLKPIQQVLWYGYIIAGFIGGILPFVKERLVLKNKLFNFIPPRWLSGYFIPLFLYGMYRSFIGAVYYKTWEESIELILSIGVFLYVFHFQFKAWKSKKTSGKKSR